MKILVTGSSGFIGSELVKSLRQDGHEVFRALRYVSGGRYDYYDSDQRVFFDLRDSREVKNALMVVKPDVVFHLAAQSAVSYSFDHPEEVADVNYMGTVRIAEACREIGAWLIFAGTSECFGRTLEFPIHEHTSLGGTSPYAASKIAAVEYLETMQRIYQNPITIVFPFNTIGRAIVKNRHFVVERAICQAVETGRIELHDPRPFRDFMFRTDHVGLYRKVLETGKKAYGERFLACTGAAWSIAEMANEVRMLVSTKTGKPVSLSFSQVPDRPLDIERLQGTNIKALQILGWLPQYTIQQAIEKTVDEWLEVLVGSAG